MRFFLFFCRVYYGVAERCVKLSPLFWTIGFKLYRQVVGIPMGTNFALLISGWHKDADIINLKAFNSTSRYLEDLLNIDNTYMYSDCMVNQQNFS